MCRALWKVMNLNRVLQWEMHSPAGDVRFRAAREGDGYSVMVEKDGAMALAATAPDGVTLLKRSQQLRAALKGLGYGVARLPQPATGAVWGSGFPPSLVSIFRD
jgi:hypothetical protein